MRVRVTDVTNVTDGSGGGLTWVRLTLRTRPPADTSSLQVRNLAASPPSSTFSPLLRISTSSRPTSLLQSASARWRAVCDGRGVGAAAADAELLVKLFEAFDALAVRAMMDDDADCEPYP